MSHFTGEGSNSKQELAKCIPVQLYRLFALASFEDASAD